MGISTKKTTHPSGLYVLFTTEMWERFSYYGMRALLVLYLVANLDNFGFGMGRKEALAIYAIFTGLVYLTPIIGGWAADRFLGKRKAVYTGAVMMAAGQFLLAASAFMAHSLDPDLRFFIFSYGLGCLIFGNGFFKPNISTIVGDLYDDNDPRKDSAFNIFYMGINLGAILGPFLAGALGEQVHWGWGFFSAGVGMLISMLILFAKETSLNGYGLPPHAKLGQTRLTNKDWAELVVLAVVLILLTGGIIWGWRQLPDTTTDVIVKAGFAVLILGLLWVIVSNTKGATEWSRMGVILVLAFFNVAFWAGFEQAGGTFNLFAEEKTNRFIEALNWEVPTTWFQNINPLAILIFAPLFSVMWLKLDQRKLNPRTPIKFALGLLLGGLAFAIMTQADALAEHGKVSPLWLVAVYVILTLGELMLSPIGLSMITKLAPRKLVSVVMGLWMASFAAGNYLAGMLETFLEEFNAHQAETQGFMLELYPFITYWMLGSGIVLILLSPLLNKAMKGIH
ncbi:MAG: dihydroorotate dehydrogenase [Thermonema sp.]|uniref:peptide MFS transporter n=1 Tax=Thermonema TaxID=28194 RepID=UPI000570ABF5|nr:MULTISPECIES: peptide MFS transporter [Thermonema]GIV38858.1 MAG: dihydroorotate dehydrogenase [Thermonema sp.]